MTNYLTAIRLTLTTTCLLLIASKTQAQNHKSNCISFKDDVTHLQVYGFADKMPQPVIGLKKLTNAVFKRLKFDRQHAGAQGNVWISFVVKTDGSIIGGRVVRDIAGTNQFYSSQILKLIKGYQWKPGFCGNKPVPVLYTVPFSIQLRR